MNTRLIPFVLLVACGTPATTYVSAASAPPERSVAVTGTARVDLVPDESCIELTLSVRDSAISVSHEGLMAHVSSLLEALGEDDSLRVERGAIRYAPYYEDIDAGYPRTRRVTGHAATARINVRTQDFERIPGVVSLAATRGLERVDVVFYSTELVARKAALRRQALEAARDKADDMAGTLGTSIGEVISIREAGASNSAQVAMLNVYTPTPQTDSTPSLPPQPGSIPLTLSVDIVYALSE